jgi:hypothetical protein
MRTECHEKAWSPPGEIAADCAYTLREFSRRTGLGRWAIRRLRRDGLIVRRVSGRAFVVGSDWIAFLGRMASET